MWRRPCELVKQLKQSGVNFVMHVVGFDVHGGAKKQLSCIADASGGKLSADSVSELQSAFQAVEKSVVEKKQIVVPTPVPTVAPITQK